jgi:hypothetical protein
VAGALPYVCLRGRGDGIGAVPCRRRQAEWENVLLEYPSYVDGVVVRRFDSGRNGWRLPTKRGVPGGYLSLCSAQRYGSQSGILLLFGHSWYYFTCSRPWSFVRVRMGRLGGRAKRSLVKAEVSASDPELDGTKMSLSETRDKGNVPSEGRLALWLDRRTEWESFPVVVWGFDGWTIVPGSVRRTDTQSRGMELDRAHAGVVGHCAARGRSMLTPEWLGTVRSSDPWFLVQKENGEVARAGVRSSDLRRSSDSRRSSEPCLGRAVPGGRANRV